MPHIGSHQKNGETLLSETAEILRSPEFIRSPVMAKLLNYLVRHHIEHPNNPPKAYQVAVDALGKDEDFDVQADSYPRVQIGRLRNMLVSYYAIRGEKARIGIPIGNYSIYADFTDIEDMASEEPHIVSPVPNSDTSDNHAHQANNPTPGEKPLSFQIKEIFANFKRGVSVTLAALAAISSVIWFSDGSPEASAGMSIAQARNPVLPPKLFIISDNHGESGQNKASRKISDYFMSSFGRFNTLTLAMSGERAASGNSQNAYELRTTISSEQDGYGLQLHLLSIDDDRLVWTKSLDLDENLQSLEAILSTTVSQLSSTYGIIAVDQRKKLRGNDLVGYSCILKFDEYRATRDKALLGTVDRCIERSLEADPYDSQILAAASFVAYLREEATGRSPDPTAGAAFAQKAVVRGRDDAIASFALARSGFFSGQCGRAKKYAERAISINPLEATIQAYTGAYLSACDDPDAEGYLRRAIELDPHDSIIAETALVLTLMSQGKDVEALDVAEKITPSSESIGPYYDLTMAMVLAKNGHTVRSQAAWQKLQRVYAADHHEEADTMVARLITNPRLAKKALTILKQAKVITS